MKTLFTLLIGAALAFVALKRTDLSRYVCSAQETLMHSAVATGLLAHEGVSENGHAAAIWTSDDAPSWEGRSDEVVIDERFNVSPGERLMVDVADADLEIKIGTDDQAHIRVFLGGRDMDRARNYFEALDFRVGSQNGEVQVVTTKQRPRSWNWRTSGWIRVRVEATIPSHFDLNLKTSDGDINVATLRGNAVIQTSDGDVRVATLEGGTLHIQTSDGDVSAASLTGSEITVKTSDGDLNLGVVQSNNNHIQTSDGDVAVEAIQGMTVLRTSDGDIVVREAIGSSIDLKTSDGDVSVGLLVAGKSSIRSSDGTISVERAEGELIATTSSGDVSVGLAKPATLELRTSDGDVTVRLPRSLAADLLLYGDEVRVSSSFSFDGTLKKNSADGSVNGGGPRVSVRAGDGSVRILADD